MRPLQRNNSNPTQTAGLPLASAGATATGHRSWTDELHKLQPYANPYSTLDLLIRKVSNDPQTILEMCEIGKVVQACMFHGQIDLLSLLLAQQPLDELTVPPNDANTLSYALNTLLEALPRDWSVRKLTFWGHVLDSSDCTLLFNVLDRIKPSSLRLDRCTVSADLHMGLPDCHRLPMLEDLDLDITGGAFSLLKKILVASQLGSLSLRSNARLITEQHADIANSLETQGTLRKLSLHFARAESLDPVIRFYASFLKSQTTFEHVDLSGTPLSADDCGNLWEALQNKHLPHLSLSGCWLGMAAQTTPENAAKLCSLQNLVRLDFSGNSIHGDQAAPVLATLIKHPTLQYLNLDETYVPDEVFDAFVSDLAGNTTLVSLQLPYMPDANFACLAKAMESNRSLQYLSAPFVEKYRGSVNFLQDQQGYLALVEHARINKRRSERAPVVEVVAGGVQQALNGLVHDRQDAPLDVARYAANIALATDDLDMDMVMGWTTLNRRAAREASEARARLEAQARKK